MFLCNRVIKTLFLRTIQNGVARFGGLLKGIVSAERVIAGYMVGMSGRQQRALMFEGRKELLLQPELWRFVYDVELLLLDAKCSVRFSAVKFVGDQCDFSNHYEFNSRHRSWEHWEFCND